MAEIVEALSIVNADGGSAVFTAGTAAATNGGVAVQQLLWTPAMSSTPQPKGDKSGLHESFSYAKGMSILATGLIIGTAATDYWARRATLAAAVLPDSGTLSSKNHGTVFATFAGTAYYAGVTVQEWSAPLDLTGPYVSPYTVRWLNPNGYWKLVSSDADVRL